MPDEWSTPYSSSMGDSLSGVGARLLLPLHQLENAPAQRRPRTLDLDRPATDPLAIWLTGVRSAQDACVLLDAAARVVAASSVMAPLLTGPPAAWTGARFADLVNPVDFTSGAAPHITPEMAMPPLRALATEGLARGLMRLRLVDGAVVTYDVVSVPVCGAHGVLSFFLAV